MFVQRRRVTECLSLSRLVGEACAYRGITAYDMRRRIQKKFKRIKSETIQGRIVENRHCYPPSSELNRSVSEGYEHFLPDVTCFLPEATMEL